MLFLNKRQMDPSALTRSQYVARRLANGRGWLRVSGAGTPDGGYAPDLVSWAQRTSERSSWKGSGFSAYCTPERDDRNGTEYYLKFSTRQLKQSQFLFLVLTYLTCIYLQTVFLKVIKVHSGTRQSFCLFAFCFSCCCFYFLIYRSTSRTNQAFSNTYLKCVTKNASRHECRRSGLVSAVTC